MWNSNLTNHWLSQQKCFSSAGESRGPARGSWRGRRSLLYFQAPLGFQALRCGSRLQLQWWQRLRCRPRGQPSGWWTHQDDSWPVVHLRSWRRCAPRPSQWAEWATAHSPSRWRTGPWRGRRSTAGFETASGLPLEALQGRVLCQNNESGRITNDTLVVKYDVINIRTRTTHQWGCSEWPERGAEAGSWGWARHGRRAPSQCCRSPRRRRSAHSQRPPGQPLGTSYCQLINIKLKQGVTYHLLAVLRVTTVYYFVFHCLDLLVYFCIFAMCNIRIKNVNVVFCLYYLTTYDMTEAWRLDSFVGRSPPTAAHPARPYQRYWKRC